ncbi:hypothetical protein NMG60_11014183 [Bertholletia excelsa]
MNGIQNSRSRNLEKPFPGCLGRMVNFFDLSTGVTGSRLLTDKPHRDGSRLSRARPDAARMSHMSDAIEDKAIVYELRRSSSNKKSNGTPMKMLIAQEMSKEVESKHNPPNVVAKLMGLDALPDCQLDKAAQNSQSRGYLQSPPLDYWEQQHGLDIQMQHDIHQCPEPNLYKDVYEVWQQSWKDCYLRDKSPQNGRHREKMNEKKMAFVRQKFMEAKRLSMDEKLRGSKQFHDALEVLNSNRDLFLMFLQEPNSMFSQQVYDGKPTPSPTETKRITVLRPSKMVDNSRFSGSGNKNEKQIKKASPMDQVIGWDKSNPRFSPPSWRVNESPSQPTRIVVLKPSPGKPHDVKAVVSPPSTPPRGLYGEEFYGEPADCEAHESQEVAKEITRQMHENLGGPRRDEALISSVFPHGYVGDGSSFNKLENEYQVENLSESEVVSPTSRHSWDYINRFGSPYSSSSFSRASYSPESSVCREAKKRLSERWALMASNGNGQEQRHVRRSSSTLGEMLALSDTKNSLRSEMASNDKEQETRGSTSYAASTSNNNENVESSPRNLLRSKSVPASSTDYISRLNISDPETSEARRAKSSFKGKVSSLFFSRNKKASKENSIATQSKNESKRSAAVPVESVSKISEDTSNCASGIEVGLLPDLGGSSSKALSPDLVSMGLKQGEFSQEEGLSATKPVVSRIPSENQEQPSPISVLEPPFEEDDSTSADSSIMKTDKHGGKLSAHYNRSNLIDKSPPIESIARTLSWDDSCLDSATSYPPKSSMVSHGTEEDEREWLFFVQSLLSAAGLSSDAHSDSFFARWHSPESPLDPSLRERYTNLETEIMPG